MPLIVTRFSTCHLSQHVCGFSITIHQLDFVHFDCFVCCAYGLSCNNELLYKPKFVSKDVDIIHFVVIDYRKLLIGIFILCF